jgi:spermidine synthase
MQQSWRTPVLDVPGTTPSLIADSRGRTVLWLATAAVAGAVMMALEMAASRLYAPYFGYSVYVWGSMISVVMAALAAGYAAGGWLADRMPAQTALFLAILASAAYQLIALYTMGSLLTSLAPSGDFLGAGAATAVLFAPSMAALAASGPVLVRLCSRSGRVGSAAGKVYALSTIGSMAGILVASFSLLPHIGTHGTLRLLCAVSFAVAGAGLIARIRYPIVAVVLALGILCSPDLGWGDNTIWSKESAYNLVRVVRKGTRTFLLLNHQTSVHTVREESGTWTGYYYDVFAVGPLLTRADRALVLGMGAGASIHAMRTVAPQIDIDAVEIDPQVVKAAERWFAIDPTDPRLHIHVADARPWLLRSRRSYDVVQVDLYQGGPYVPFYLVTEEFFRLVRAHVTGDGLLMMNVFDTGSRQELVASIGATLRRAFPSVVAVPGSNGNTMLIAFAQNHSVDSLRPGVAGGLPAAGLPDVIRTALASAIELRPTGGTPVFTDDCAPIEEMTRRMLAGESQRTDAVRSREGG